MSAPAPPLGAAVRILLRQAIEAYQDSPQALGWLKHNLQRFDEPLRVAIAGKVKAGKSTLLNALVGEQIAPTDAGECTRIVTWYVDAQFPRVTMYPRTSAPKQLTINRAGGGLSFDLQGTPVEQVDKLEVEWPSQSLRTQTLIDTPGIASLSADTSARAGAFLAPEDAPTPGRRRHLPDAPPARRRRAASSSRSSTRAWRGPPRSTRSACCRGPTRSARAG